MPHKTGEIVSVVVNWAVGVVGVGWVERSETHHRIPDKVMGFAALNPSYSPIATPRLMRRINDAGQYGSALL